MDTKSIRALAGKLGKETLAKRLGVSVNTLRGWLNGRQPNASAQVLLKLIARHEA